MQTLQNDPASGAGAAPNAQPTPARILETLLFSQARQQALRTAIELDVFTAIAEGWRNTETLAERCEASQRGIRTLCDFLVVNGFLTKSAGEYGLTPDTRTFLDRRSPIYFGSVATFLGGLADSQRFNALTECVRKGSTVNDITDDADRWVTFAHAMVPVAAPVAAAVAGVLEAANAGPIHVLDIAAGHGEYGLAIARANQKARVVGLDLKDVVEVARQRAFKMGVSDQYDTIEGSAFDVAFGGPYDIVLVPNLLHHFETAKVEALLKKVAAALKPGGRVVLVEFVPNEDRVSPPVPAMFSLTMLTFSTGDAYTLAELDEMLGSAGFAQTRSYPALPTPQTIVVSKRV